MPRFDLQRLRQISEVGQVLYRETTDSTNTWARQSISEHAHSNQPIIFLAGHQTAGRGQQGRSWWTASGALAMSWMWYPDAKQIRLTSTALASALAIASTLKRFSDDVDPKIKWPNDVYLSGRKFAGILIENVAQGDHAAQIIGIGCNLNHSFAEAPEEIRAVATSWFDQTGQTIDLTEFTATLFVELASSLNDHQHDERRFLAACEKFAWVPQGTPLQIQLPNGRSMSGAFAGYGSDGQLQLLSDGKLIQIVSGTVLPSPV